MCSYLSLILSAVLAVLCAHAQEKNSQAQICKYLLLTSAMVHSYVLCIIPQPWYCKTIMHVHSFVMSKCSACTPTSKTHIVSTALQSPCPAMYCVSWSFQCYLQFVPYCGKMNHCSSTISWLFKKGSSNQNKASETFSCANIFLKKG